MIQNANFNGLDLQKHIVSRLKQEYGDDVFKAWFSKLELIEIRGDTIYLSVPSNMAREWIITNYYHKIRRIIHEKFGDIRLIDLRVKNWTKDSPNLGIGLNTLNTNITQTQEDRYDRQSWNIDHILDQRMTFENFTVSSSNVVAHNAALDFKNNVNLPSLNRVLYIHSVVGLGKTHLLQSIANSLKKSQPEFRFLYLSAERFMHHYVVSVQHNKVIKFRNFLRSLDLLIVDDIQFLCNRSAMEKEFLNTFNAFIEGGKGVVLAADRPPYDLPLEEHFKSRLNGSLIVDIQNPDLELRYQILKNKSVLLEYPMPNEVLHFIASNIDASIRELEAAMHRVMVYARANKMAVTIEVAKQILKECIEASKPNNDLESIIQNVAKFYGVDKSDLLSKNRKSILVKARKVSAFLCRKYTTCSYEEIGEKLGGRDHSTMIYLIKSIQKQIDLDQNVAQELESMMS